MGCVDSKEKRFDQQQYQQQQQYHNQQRQRAAAQQRRQQQHQHGETGQQHTLQKYRQQHHHQQQHQQQQQNSSRRPSQGSNGSGGRDGRPGLMTSGPGLRAPDHPAHQGRDTDRERRVVTDPRGRRTRDPREASGQHHQEPETQRPGGFGQRNQFDRASQLRRSKKRKKSRENSILESSRSSEKSMERSLNVSKTCAKDIAIEETVKTLKTSLGPSSEAAENNDSRAEYHTKYGNLI